jgi:tetratricopeptide (TPR) repeat protein/AraC-like DNA-binding protein
MTENVTNDQIFIRKLAEIVLANLGNEEFDTNELVLQSGISRNRLSRKLHSIRKKTISQFIREVRLLKALEMLQNEDFTAAEVSYKTGFNSPTYFNKCFHDLFGYPPGEVKKREPGNQDLHIPGESEDNTVLNIDTRNPHFLTLSFILILIVIFLVIGLLITKEIGKHDLPEEMISTDGRIPVVIMPFRNMTNDTIWKIWQEGIQYNLITSLSNFPEDLKVRKMESVNGILKNQNIIDYESITPDVSGLISRKLGANVCLFGNICKSGSTLRVNAQLINSKTGESLKAFQIDGASDNILPVIDSLSVLVQKFLIITLMKKELNREDWQYVNTKSPEAFRYYLCGVKAFIKSDFTLARDFYMKSIAIDSDYYDAFYGIYFSYVNEENWVEAKKWCLRFYRKSDMMPVIEKIWINYAYAFCFETPDEEIKYLNILKDIDKISGDPYLLTGTAYYRLKQYNKAINELEKARLQYDKWGTKPEPVWTYTYLAGVYNKTGQYKKERQICKEAEKVFPNDPDVRTMQSILYLSEGKSRLAERYIDSYISLRKEQSWSETSIASSLAEIYSEAGIQEKAEEYYMKALSLEPENPVRINNLAYFLINKGLNIDKGLELAEKALELIPDDYRFLYTKGCGLYKKGKIKEALNILERSWNLRREVSVYDHDACLQLLQAKNTYTAIIAEAPTDSLSH